jgi:hypothetical protein
MVLYPDPGVISYISNVAFSSTTAASVAILQAGYPPMVFEGPIQPSSLFMISASSANVTWYGQ